MEFRQNHGKTKIFNHGPHRHHGQVQVKIFSFFEVIRIAVEVWGVLAGIGRRKMSAKMSAKLTRFVACILVISQAGMA
ncbi:MAG: hypothetical protein LBQ61_01890, partial [Spirochaetales bacterium]|nr:hypothetical protein [Spirochaetales bacterium]